jgi:hypothetical protein
MLNRAIDEPRGRGGGRPWHGLAPDLAWPLVGGAVALALGLLLYVLAVSVGEWVAGTPQQGMTRLASAPMYREFAGLFLAGALAIYLVREFSLRTR